MASDWCRGRSWIVRAPLLGYLAWIGIHHVRDPDYESLFGGITLGVHELGHLLLFWAGSFLSIAGGSLAQVGAPVGAAIVLGRQRDYFGISVAGGWLSFSLFGLSRYVGDARARDLPLVALFPEPVHDWNWLLGHAGLLEWDHGLAMATRGAAVLVWAASLLFGGWLLAQMAVSTSDGRPATPGSGA